MSIHIPKSVKVGKRQMPLPESRTLRILLGVVLLICGFLGFLPVIGYWMIPLGLIVLSVDIPAIRRWRRRVEVKWGRWRQRRRDARTDGAGFKGASTESP